MVKGKRIHTKKWQSCVKKVKKKGGDYNPFAVCTASIGKKGSILKSHRRMGSRKLKRVI